MKRALFVLTFAAVLATAGLRAHSVAAAGAPVVNPGGPYAGLAGLPLTFSGAASTDSGTDLTYVWTFSDGDSAAGPAVVKVFTAPGSYGVALTVSDALGLSATAYTTASISSTAGTAPVAAGGSAAPSQLIDPATIGLCANGIAIINGLVFDCNTGRLIGTIQTLPSLFCTIGQVIYLNGLPYSCGTSGGGSNVGSGAAPAATPPTAPSTP